jgi:3',5'-cyclic AMP phosphodiesterase CpdA
MKSQEVDIVVFNGDNTNKDTPSYASNLLKMANASGMEALWVRGNHDLRKTSKYYFKCSYNISHYYVDRSGWRIIVLDSNYSKPNGWGGIDDPQVEWLKTVITEATGSVIVFMHHPIFMINEKRPDEIYPGYTYLESVLSASGKVQYVISGHVHVLNQFSKSLNGVQYYTNIPLNLMGRIGSYQILDLPE